MFVISIVTQANNLIILDSFLPTKREIKGLVEYVDVDMKLGDLILKKLILCNTIAGTVICSVIAEKEGEPVTSREIAERVQKVVLQELSRVE